MNPLIRSLFIYFSFIEPQLALNQRNKGKGAQKASLAKGSQVPGEQPLYANFPSLMSRKTKRLCTGFVLVCAKV